MNSREQQFSQIAENLTLEHLALVEKAKTQLNSVCEKEEQRLGKEAQRLEKEEKRLQEESKKLDERIHQWKVTTSKLEKTHFPSVVKLNVGGKAFATSLGTLTRYTDSYFGVMFSKRWETKPGEDGSYFIDKNPKMFPIILDYMRGEELDLNLSPAKKSALLRDARFYQLDELVRMLGEEFPPPPTETEWELQTSPNGYLSNNSRTFKKMCNGWNCNVLGSIGWTAGIHQWTVSLDANCTDLMIGVAPATTTRAGANFASVGFYLYTLDGKLYGQGVPFNRSQTSQRCNADGTRITVKLDMDRKTLCYAVNGVWQTNNWRDLPAAILYPSFDVYSALATFSVMRY